MKKLSINWCFARKPDFDSQRGYRVISSALHPDQLWSPQTPLWSPSPGVKRISIKLTTHLHPFSNEQRSNSAPFVCLQSLEKGIFNCILPKTLELSASTASVACLSISYFYVFFFTWNFNSRNYTILFSYKHFPLFLSAVRNCLRNNSTTIIGNVVGLGTMLQAGRSRIQIPMKSLFFNSLYSSSRSMDPELTQILTEMSTRNVPGVKARPASKADILTDISEPIV
jgi:hypothetical protein